MICAATFTGCDSSPTNKLLNPAGSAVIVNAPWTNSFLIYKNELMVDGRGVQFFTSQEGQVLDFNSTENVASGSTKTFKYSWDGSRVTPYTTGISEVTWAGFGLEVLNSNGSPATKDITPGAYKYLSFKIKGSLSSNVALRVEFRQSAGTVFDIWWQSNPGDSRITDSWQTYNFDLQGYGLKAAKLQYYLIISFQNLGTGQSNGGTVYLEDIQFTQVPQ